MQHEHTPPGGDRQGLDGGEVTAPRPRPPRFLSVNEIAELLGISRMSVYRLVNSGDLQAYRIGRTIRVRPADFTTFMRGVAMSDLWDEET